MLNGRRFKVTMKTMAQQFADIRRDFFAEPGDRIPGSGAADLILKAIADGGGVQNNRRHVCDGPGCTKKEGGGTRFSKCSGCRKVRFCGTACAKAAWPTHKLVCISKKSKPKVQPKGGQVQASK